jgi:predicted nuclease of predicted toxin-antitoxin system
MKLLADENVDEPIVDWLVAMGVDLSSIRRTRPGLSDPQVVEVARAEERVILTNDLDFGELVFRRRMGAAGIILLRVNPPLPDVRLAVLQRHWDEIASKAVGHFIVVTQRKLRIRPLI